ncbi:N-terminal C2 in EEIG1 and EHBP1 proteins-domain-containing protein [Apodospora peruviana]|uniref:N-terminal C2 in EEIG1 and EHBP1 proteins-domain-containing protein n=1 Tax=Apodospora peruviana TaxID=516989 RepID=A0AAE0ISW1_9PEZI|nr:N-terminal C2 in EEIG1 and EHBP1 proteins-domain-containing protein [Apodospora peruviana]
MQFLPLVNKARKPKFDLHLTIYDLNNVPLVSGVSLIKWHLPHSIHGEHRGRTPKCPIANHRVEYNYSKLVPLRIAIDRNNNLAECLIEFEVLQEFSVAGSAGAIARDEKITLGTVRINLSEYIEESEAILRDGSNAASKRTSLTALGSGDKSGHHRKRSSMSGISLGGPDASPMSSHRSETEEERPAADVREGVVRRYLMQESKINSTLKLGILMVQVDGERNFVAPPLKTAPVFGGIAGIVAGDALEPTDPSADASGGQLPSLSNKSRDVFELQDAYRRVLAASWTCQPGELPADQCIEDIFAGGDGFRTEPKAHKRTRSQVPAADPSSTSTHGSIATGVPNRTPSTGSSVTRLPREDSGSTSGDEEGMSGTLRPRDMARLQFHLRNQSGLSDRTTGTVTDRDHESSRGIGVTNNTTSNPLSQNIGGMHHHRELLAPLQHAHHHRRESSKDTVDGGLRSRSGSLTSLATTVGTDRGRDGFKHAREVEEFEIRDDLVAWAVPGIKS